MTTASSGNSVEDKTNHRIDTRRKLHADDLADDAWFDDLSDEYRAASRAWDELKAECAAHGVSAFDFADMVKPEYQAVWQRLNAAASGWSHYRPWAD